MLLHFVIPSASSTHDVLVSMKSSAICQAHGVILPLSFAHSCSSTSLKLRDMCCLGLLKQHRQLHVNPPETSSTLFGHTVSVGLRRQDGMQQGITSALQLLWHDLLSWSC